MKEIKTVIQEIIDAQNADPFNAEETTDALTDALELLEKQPEIVRCKDCKWYKEGYDIDGKWFTRCNGDVRVYGHTKPDWFCGDGEKAVKQE